MFEASLELVRKGVEEGAYPSAAVAIGREDKLFALKTYGCACTSPNCIPADENTLYDMASMTKIVATTFIALKMLEGGLISLYDRIGSYFDTPADKKEINIFHLLTHTSGISAHFMLNNSTSCSEQAVQEVLNSKPELGPGKDVIYSCMGYILLGKILEKVGGKPLDKLAKEMVFDPLCMYSTGYNPSDGIFADTEWDAVSGSYLCGVVHDENARALCGVSGNAGVFSNIMDAVKFASMLSMKGGTPQSRFISKDIFEQAIRNYTSGMSESRGLGFKLADERTASAGDLLSTGSYGHTGFTGTSLWVDAETGIYIVLLTNRVRYGRNNLKILSIRRNLHSMVKAEAAKSML